GRAVRVMAGAAAGDVLAPPGDPFMCTGGGVAAGDLAHRVGDRGQPVYARPTLPPGLSGEVPGYRSRFAHRAGARREGRYAARAKRPPPRPQPTVADRAADR